MNKGMSLLRQMLLVALAFSMVLSTISAEEEPSARKQAALVDYLQNMINRAQRSGEMAAQKRGGEGVWVYMPGQGYVQVPAELAATAGKAANGKLMRYGR